MAQLKNSCGLGMMILLLMHTGSRPGNVGRLLQGHLYFKGMHAKVYWLTLAFIKPATLAHMVHVDAIKDIVFKVHNGYKKRGKEKRDEFRIWAKKSIPEAYNSLDLPLVYAIYWQMILSFDFDYLAGDKVFANTPQTYSANFAARNKWLGLENLVLYSMRYSTSKDDNAREIPMDIRWKRMAHSRKSELCVSVYAKCDKEVVMQGSESEGSESGSESDSESDDEPILMNPLNDENDDNMVTVSSYLTKTFPDPDMRADFVGAAEADRAGSASRS